MPVYQYRCKGCGKVFEVTCHLDDRKKLAVCPGCGSKKVQQVFTSFVCAPPAKW